MLFLFLSDLKKSSDKSCTVSHHTPLSYFVSSGDILDLLLTFVFCRLVEKEQQEAIEHIDEVQNEIDR